MLLARTGVIYLICPRSVDDPSGSRSPRDNRFMRTTGDYYRAFAAKEAHGSSATYEAWALGIADDAVVIGWLDDMPQPKRQANLLFAAARSLGAPVGSWPAFREWLGEHWHAVRALMMRRTTQTNEAGRCATLLPAFQNIPGPLALIEVGAAAGLCLYPDRYSYEYRFGRETVRLDPTVEGSGVVLRCDYEGARPPGAIPQVVWRAGIDLNPLDMSDPEAYEWLEYLIWPEHDARRRTLAGAARVAVADPPQIVRADLLTELPRLAASAPPGATLVVFHTAVMAYLPVDDRERFVAMVGELGCVWVSNEGPGTMPMITEKLSRETREQLGTSFVLAIDGEPFAATSPHGFSFREL